MFDLPKYSFSFFFIYHRDELFLSIELLFVADAIHPNFHGARLTESERNAVANWIDENFPALERIHL